MRLIIRILLTAVAVFLIAEFLPGVSVASYVTAIIVAVVLAILNLIVKPILVILTLPVTILTLGLFLLVINAIIILLADSFVTGFGVDGFWIALIFSLLLSVFQSILFSILGSDQEFAEIQAFETLSTIKNYVLLHTNFYNKIR